MSDPGAPCEVHVLVPRLGGGAVLVQAGSTGQAVLPVIRLRGEVGERPASIFAGVRASTPFEWLLSIQALDVDEQWRTTLALVEAEATEIAPAGHAWAAEDAVLAATRPEAVRAALERSLRAAATRSGEGSAPWVMPGRVNLSA